MTYHLALRPNRIDGGGGGGHERRRRRAVPVPAGVRVLREQLRQAEQLPRRRRRARQGAGGEEGGFGVRRRQPGAHGGGRRGRAQGRRPRHWHHSYHSDGQGDNGGDGGGGAGGGEHAREEGGDGAEVGRVRGAAGRVRDAGRSPGGDRVGAAGHPRQARRPPQRRRLLRLPPRLHRQGRRRRLHPPLPAPPLRLLPRRLRPRPQARGVRAGAGRRPGDAEAALGGRAGRRRLQLFAPRPDCPLAKLATRLLTNRSAFS